MEGMLEALAVQRVWRPVAIGSWHCLSARNSIAVTHLAAVAETTGSQSSSRGRAVTAPGQQAAAVAAAERPAGARPSLAACFTAISLTKEHHRVGGVLCPQMPLFLCHRRRSLPRKASEANDPL